MKKTMLFCAALALTATPALANKDKMHGDHQAMADAMFKKMDANSDGMISSDEHAAASSKMFSDADGNSDGNLTKEELRAFKMKEKDKMKSSMNSETRPPASRETKQTTN